MSPGDAVLLRATLDDIDVLSEMAQAWDLDFRQLRPETFEFEICQVVAGPIQVGRCRMAAHLYQRGSTPPGVRTIGLLAEPGFKSVAPGKGEIKAPPVSVCHQVSTMGQRPSPTTS